jgi:diamine N-acetyltransferase
MEQINIQRAEVAQLAQLQAIGRQTFFETFAAVNTAEDMEKYLNTSFSTEKLTAELYFAVSDGAVIGYLKVNFGPSQTELKDDRALEIERIYVAKAFHGQSVGQLLYQKAIEVAKSHQLAYVWLGVWEENHRALQFYRKNGFVAFGKHQFKLGDDEQTDLMMRLEVG